MLPKENRLKKKRDFDVVFRKGRGFKNGFLFLKIAENKLGISRFGFIIGKKLSKQATIRNRVRRRIAELVRLKLKKLKPGIDVVFVAFPGLEKNSYREIEEIVNKLFVRAKVFLP